MYTIIRYLTIAILLGTTLFGCNTIQKMKEKSKNNELTNKFELSFLLYRKYLRWGNLKEITNLMTENQVPSAIKKLDSLKNIKISRVEPGTWKLDKDKLTMTGDITVDYYIVDRGVVRSTTQHQVWRYNEESKVWRLDTGLPDLQ